MSSANIEKCFESAVTVAKQAGKVIKEGISKRKQVELKSSPVDLVTETDKAVEELVIRDLQMAYPDHKFIGEESVAAGAKCELTDAPTWIIDPVDGTMNFVHSFPFTCISIALWENKQPLIGVVYNPILDQLYTAKIGQGAYLNGEQIKVSGEKELSKSLIMTEQGFRPDAAKMNIVRSNTKKLIEQSHGIRCVGSAALHMCLVASGGADAALSLGLYAWDKAASTLIVLEAGGEVIDNTGAPHDLLCRRVLCAASKELAQQMVAQLDVYEEERV